MTRLRWSALVGVLALVAAACGTPAATTTTTGAVETTTTTAAASTTTSAGPAFEGASLVAPNCDYGGKISSIEATAQYEVVFTLCSPFPAFPQVVAFTPFGFEPAEHLEATGGAPLNNPIGTGPFKLDSWNLGESVNFSANPDYWGEAPAFQTLVFRWAPESATRLVELQAGTADWITNLAAADIPAVEADSNLTLLPVLNPNVFYIGMNSSFAPFDNVDVRRAIAMGVNRDALVTNYYPPGSEVATHFTPCAIENGCQGDEWYPFDAEAARALLEGAGADGLEVTLYYRNVFRVYLPEPAAVAQAIAEQLNEDLGMNVTVQEVESSEFSATVTAHDTYAMFLYGWGADYPHITNFLDFHFTQDNEQYGPTHAEVYEPVAEASSIADPATAAPLYEEANNAIRDLVPLVPIAHGAASDAALATVEGAQAPNFGAPQFELLNPGKDTFVFMQNAEPQSLYCADQSDGESLSACQQVVEALFGYDLEGNVIPKLATECTANDDSTVWTCTLREGVKFHDGSDFDANDVVANFTAWLDASSPLHVGNTGAFEYPAYLWGGLINAES
jgi:ABC-type transport system substrate-binding protein